MDSEDSLLNRLTEREKEILALIALGKNNHEIAASLKISYLTVQNHVHRLLEKLNMRNRTEASSLYWRFHLRRSASADE